MADLPFILSPIFFFTWIWLFNWVLASCSCSDDSSSEHSSHSSFQLFFFLSLSPFLFLFFSSWLCTVCWLDYSTLLHWHLYPPVPLSRFLLLGIVRMKDTCKYIHELTWTYIGLKEKRMDEGQPWHEMALGVKCNFALVFTLCVSFRLLSPSFSFLHCVSCGFNRMKADP